MTSKNKDQLFHVEAFYRFNFWHKKLKDTAFYPLFKKQQNTQQLELFGNSKELPFSDNTLNSCKIKATAN